jgi:hypothetical protein
MSQRKRTMKEPKLIDIISNENGSLSRTQAVAVALVVYAMLLIIAHVIFDFFFAYKVITPIVLTLYFPVLIIGFMERMDIRHLQFNVSKDGIKAKVGAGGDGNV